MQFMQTPKEIRKNISARNQLRCHLGERISNERVIAIKNHL
jgi:hypothetical protein